MKRNSYDDETLEMLQKECDERAAMSRMMPCLMECVKYAQERKRQGLPIVPPEMKRTGRREVRA